MHRHDRAQYYNLGPNPADLLTWCQTLSWCELALAPVKSVPAEIQTLSNLMHNYPQWVTFVLKTLED